MVGTGWWEQGSGNRVVGTGWWEQGSGNRVVGTGWWEQGGGNWVMGTVLVAVSVFKMCLHQPFTDQG